MKIVILTGAGVSAESGLGTFRDRGGVWDRYDLTQVATPEGFARDPARVQDFYNARRANAAEAEPNAAHRALARLQAAGAHKVTLVTQNIDDLHERAGSRGVLHMHGEIRRALCAACGHRWDAPMVMRTEDPCPACAAPRTRPDVVWFGEIPYHMEDILVRVADCDLFAAIGTSGTVYPAAGFGALAQEAGARTVEINLDPSGALDETRAGPATVAVPDWVDGLLA